jgi:hypothetical protein
MTLPTIMLLASSILRSFVDFPVKFLASLEKDLVAVIVAELVSAGPLIFPHSLNALVKLGRSKEREASVSPFPADEVL